MKLANLRIEESNYPEYFKETHGKAGSSDKKEEKYKEGKQNDTGFSATSNESIRNSVFNALTYETIKNFHLLLKFGLFTQYAAENAKAIFKDIICYLAFILEFEIDYTSELTKNGAQNYDKIKDSLKRKYIKNIADQIEMEKDSSILDIKSLGGTSMKFLTDLSNLVPIKKKNEDDDDGENGDDEEGGARANAEESANDSMSFLNTYQSLLKLISKYSNKTYRKKSKRI